MTQRGSGCRATRRLLLHDCHQCHWRVPMWPTGQCANGAHGMTPWCCWWHDHHQCHQYVPMGPTPIAITMQNEQSAALRCVNDGKETKGQKGAEWAISSAASCGQSQGEMARGNAEGQRGMQDHHQQEGVRKISKRGGHTLLHCWWFPNGEWKHVWNTLQQNCVSHSPSFYWHFFHSHFIFIAIFWCFAQIAAQYRGG